jgi:hypothetical protein
MRKLNVLVVLLMLAALAAPAQDSARAAGDAAIRWLGYVDAADYGKSWDTESSSFQSAVTKEQWEKQIAAARGPLGAVISRNETSATHTTQLPGMPDGEYVVVREQTSFEHKRSALETITLTYDRDKWRVAGYFIK